MIVPNAQSLAILFSFVDFCCIQVFSELIDIVLRYCENHQGASVRSGACQTIGSLSAWESVQGNMVYNTS